MIRVRVTRVKRIYAPRTVEALHNPYRVTVSKDGAYLVTGIPGRGLVRFREVDINGEPDRYGADERAFPPDKPRRQGVWRTGEAKQPRPRTKIRRDEAAALVRRMFRDDPDGPHLSVVDTRPLHARRP